MIVDAKNEVHPVREAIKKWWRTKSDRQIAEAIGVGNKTVSRHRKALEDDGVILPRLTHRTPESSHGSVQVCHSAILPAPLNDSIYDPVNESDASLKALAADIRENGILEPLVVSSDGYILSGHRRHEAARVVRLARIPVRIRWDVSYRVDQDEFLRLLASYNRQRVKTATEQVREELVLMSDEPVNRVHMYRRGASNLREVAALDLRHRKQRSAITQKLELRDAIIDVLYDEQRNWPLSDRAVHYRLLNVEGLVRNDKTRTPYRNDATSYKDVTNMLTRMRLDGSVPFAAIADETRPVIEWNMHKCVGDFVRLQCEKFLTGYHRDLQQSQPNWVELLVEKNTIANQLRVIAGKYGIPLTSGRGYSSLPPRKEMADRFEESGREKLIIVVVSDFDPEGEDIPVSFGVSMRDDFDIDPERLQVVKAALNGEHVSTYNLHAGQMSKESSSRHQRFVAANGDRVWELEALRSEDLRAIVERTIRQVIAVEAFEDELTRQDNDREQVRHKRNELRNALLDGLVEEE